MKRDFLLVLGVMLLYVGVKLFIKSDNFFLLVKSILVIVAGLIIFGVSFDPLKTFW